MEYFCGGDFTLYDSNSDTVSSAKCPDWNIQAVLKESVSSSICESKEDALKSTSHLPQKADDVAINIVNSHTIEDDVKSTFIVDAWSELIFGDYLDARDTYEEIKPFKYEDIELNQDELDGWLSPRVLASGLSHLWMIPGTTSYALTKLVLQNKGLEDISELLHFPHLLYIDLSHNRISDLSYLRNCKKLVYLNLSHNEISHMDDMVAPLYLSDLNLSHNFIDSMTGISSCWSLKCLDLSHNSIYCIKDVANLRFLTYLNLSYNKLKVVENLPIEHLKFLFLKCNSITNWKQGNPPFRLYRLDISYNRLTSLSFFKSLYHLKNLNISYNSISSMKEINHFGELNNLRSVIIYGNEVMDMSEMGLLILHLSPKLLYFNQFLIGSHERITAKKMYDDKLINIAYNNFLLLMTQRHTKGPQYLGLDKTYKIYNPGVVLLVGPPGSYKKRIIRQIAEKFPNFVKCCNLHTTQEKAGSGMDYVFNFVTKEEFDNLINTEQTVFHDLRYGNQYALLWSEIKLCHKICMVAVELQDALSMVWQGLRPTLIFTMTKDIDIHRARLYEEFKDFSFKFYEAFKDNRWLKCMNVKMTPEGEILDCHLRPNDIYNLLRFVNVGSEQQPDLDYSMYVLGNIYADSGLMNDTYFRRKYHFVAKEEHLLEEIAEQHSTSSSSEEVETEQKDSISEEHNEKISGDSSLSIEPSYSYLPERYQRCECPSPVASSDSSNSKIPSVSSWSVHIDSLIDYVISTRQEYIDIHENHPGLFIRGVASDDFDAAVNEIGQIAKDVYYERLYKKILTSDPLAYEIHNDPLFEEIIGKESQELLEELLEGDNFKVKIPSSDCEDTNGEF